MQSIASEQDKLATFGIVPTEANTGYGYIEKGDTIGNAFQVEKFIERPNQEKAGEFFKTNQYLCNSSMFMVKATIGSLAVGYCSVVSRLIEVMAFVAMIIHSLLYSSMQNSKQHSVKLWAGY